MPRFMTQSDRELFEDARELFNDDQAEFIVKNFSRKPHTHTAAQIEDLEEKINDIVDEAIEED